jgi:hypothetical protein
MTSIDPARLVAALAGLTIAAALTPAALAQTDTQPKSRAEVKEQTRAANKAGQLMPAGEVTPADKPASSTKTRAERKAETLEARKKGQLKPAGQATYDTNMSQRDATKGSTKTRAERKAETKQAAKDKKLIPAGEVADPAKK